MLEDTFSRVSPEASGERAFANVIAISQFHRIQASPGFRKAAEYCVDCMLETSPNSEVIHYPAESGVKFWHYPSFQEWSGKRAVLKILSPKNLAGKFADFEECPISLIQRSKATPRKGMTTQLVYVGEGKKASDYRDAKGKLAICDSHCPHDVYEAAREGGALGIVLYRQRPLEPLRKGFGVQGIRQYNSFWNQQKDLLGFVLTPDDGERIVSYLTSPESRRRPIKVWALVEGQRYPGTLEVVTSLIPGEIPKEIIVVAHLCHPRPSAGDNASGVAALLETHRVLGTLIEKRILPRPRYGIRFLLVPEMTGTFAFLSRERVVRKRLLVGLNLDMVGQKQEVTGSTLCIESPPLSSSSFTPYLLEEAVRAAFKQGCNPGSTEDLFSIKMQPTSFSGGSDHSILSDPTIGVPTPMLIQWPDKYYHTSGDTPDKVSSDVLERIVAAACTYAFTCAHASEEDMLRALSVAGRSLRKRVIDEMSRFAASSAKEWISPEYKAKFLLSSGKKALRSVRRLLPESKTLKSRTKMEEGALAHCVRRELAISMLSITVRRRKVRSHQTGRGKYGKTTIRRVLPGPAYTAIALLELGRRWQSQYRRWAKKEKLAYTMEILALYWTDGKRSLEEISRLVAAELGHTNPDFLKFYFDMLEEAGMVEITRR
jgi:aminopeptidase YwaD